MNILKSIELLLPAFEQYYEVSLFEDQEPYYAMAESPKNGYVFFAGIDILEKLHLEALNSISWEAGVGLINPKFLQLDKKVGLVIVTNKVMPDVIPQIKSARHHKHLKPLLHGWSNYSLTVLELSTGNVYTNLFGYANKSIIESIYKNQIKLILSV